MASLGITIEDLHIYIFVFVRLAAIILFNPVMQQARMPAGVKPALLMCLTIIVSPLVPFYEFDGSVLSFLVGIMGEFFIGFLLGFVFNVYYYMLMFAADIMDTQLGFSMAKTMDPLTNIQSATMGTFFNIMFMLYFFTTNCHLILINMAVRTFDAIGAGAYEISYQGGCRFAIELFSSVFLLAMRLALPFVAAEFVLEVSLGLLMKLIPQIHVFVIQMQGKILVGLALLISMMVPVNNFVSAYIEKMFSSANDAIMALVT
ncbi:MAG: flagellar biosynthetic protein FliR [Ruminococcus sp.]|nr:flagellar biosynthetic protein FliR [Ruminococcus sp.]